MSAATCPFCGSTDICDRADAPKRECLDCGKDWYIGGRRRHQAFARAAAQRPVERSEWENQLVDEPG